MNFYKFWRMKNHWIIKMGASAAMTFLVILTACENTPDTRSPNLLFVFSDQHTFDMLGCYGNEQVISPNIDQLASEGLLFNHCISNSPTCTPYRGMLMSGRHPLHNGCFTNDRPLIPGHGKKFAEVLRDAGYHTAYVGKWHLLGGDRDRPIPEGPMRYGFDELFYTNNCHVDFRPGKCFYWNEEGEKSYFDEWEVYGQTRQALEYLDGRKDQEEPFALFVSWHPPHDWGKFEGEDGKMHYRYGTLDELMEYYERDNIRVRPGMEDTPDLRRMYHGQMAMVTGVDIAFGQLMAKLKEMGADENTLVVFTSDHGDMLEFANATVPKQYPHDYSLRVPYIMRWPGKIAENKDTDLLFGALDIMPTILGLLKLDIPEEVHGKDLSQAILDGDEDAVDYVPIWSFYKHSFKGVITKEWTYSVTKTNDSPLHSVLFDRRNDPYQLANLFESEAHQSTRDSLWRLTSAWMELYEDEFYTSDDLMMKSKEEWDRNRESLPIEVLQAAR
jgi:arylsulfatase A-like enzyme